MDKEFPIDDRPAPRPVLHALELELDALIRDLPDGAQSSLIFEVPEERA